LAKRIKKKDSVRNLQPSDHGRKFSATIKMIPTEGRISHRKENNEYFFCQNSNDGLRCNDTLGYPYSWTVGDGRYEKLINYDITNFRILSMTAKEIEEYKDFKKGDVLRNKAFTHTKKIVEQLGIILFIQRNLDFAIQIYAAMELYETGWRLDITPEEEAPVVELSVAEIAMRLGLEANQLKVVDK
jgi:hypothetical protein